MEPYIVVTLLVAAVAAAVVVILLFRHLAARRREALSSVALGLGFEYLPAVEALEVEPGGARVLSRGRRHTFRNALRGRRGDTSVLLVDHSYVTGGGKNSSHHHRTLVVLRRAGLALPAFFMRPQVPVFDTIGKMVGVRDLDFPEDEAFSRAFLLQTDDEDAVRRVFGLEVRQQALGLGRTFELEAAGEALLLSRSRVVAPADAVPLIEQAIALLDVLASATRSRW
jgi:hypothetical protein